MTEPHQHPHHVKKVEDPVGPALRRKRRSQGFVNVKRVGLGLGLKPRDLYHSLISMSWPGFFASIILWYVFLNLLFATGYALTGPDSLEGLHVQEGIGYFLECFFFSVQSFATIGYGHVVPRGLAANLLVTGEALMQILSLGLVTGLFYGRFSIPRARILFSDVAVINNVDGIPSLLVRIANERRNVIASAEVNVTMLALETTAEGETYRNFFDMKLERTNTPLFALSWTIVHPIDHQSPLHGLTHQKLVDRQALILVTVAGIDDTLAQPIHARFSYTPADIHWNKKFADILLPEPDGHVQLHLERFHDTVDA